MLSIAKTDRKPSARKPAHHDDSVSDITLSDAEIMRRVSKIRSGWSTRERAARRLEAERRFAELMNSILDSAAA